MQLKSSNPRSSQNFDEATGKTALSRSHQKRPLRSAPIGEERASLAGKLLKRVTKFACSLHRIIVVNPIVILV